MLLGRCLLIENDFFLTLIQDFVKTSHSDVQTTFIFNQNTTKSQRCDDNQITTSIFLHAHNSSWGVLVLTQAATSYLDWSKSDN